MCELSLCYECKYCRCNPLYGFLKRKYSFESGYRLFFVRSNHSCIKLSEIWRQNSVPQIVSLTFLTIWCTQTVLNMKFPSTELVIQQTICFILWVNCNWCKNKCFWQRITCKIEKCRVGFSLVSLVKYLARLKPWKWPRDETSLVVSNLGCRH